MRELLNILTDNCNVIMQYEIFIILGALICTAIFAKKRVQKWIFAGVFFLTLYLHRIILPFIVTGVYAMILCGAVSAVINLDIKAFLYPVRYVYQKKDRLFSDEDRYRPALLTLSVLILIIQLARINIAIDYDSLRYGLRSDVLLTSGLGIKGFFENTGLVNNVYVYPKGFEILTRPLYFGHTYGYVLCFNIWMMLISMLTAGEIVTEVIGNDSAEPLTIASLSLIPGITNMSITAKSDLCTVLCQLFFILCAVRFIKNEDKKYCGFALAAAILSYSFKPTSLVFTSVTGLTVLIYLIIRKYRISFEKKGITAVVLSLIFTGITVARTLIITGLPFAGVFTGLFETLGFKLEYPFRAQDAVSIETAKLSEQVGKYLKRLFEFLFCPLSKDMSHVLMAWGGVVFLVMLLLSIVYFGKSREKLSELKSFAEIKSTQEREASPLGAELISVLFIAEAAMFLIFLGLLYQVDGNYFMLFYFVTVMLGMINIYSILSYEASLLSKVQGRKLNAYGMIGICLISTLMIYFTAFTGWAGPVGFTPIDIINRGYYNHEALGWKEDRIGASDDTRIVAFAYEPECYKQKGRVESWVDIDGSGGNVYLTDTKLNIFKQYCTFADIDYIYVDMYFLNDTIDTRHIRANTLFTYMLEDGDFSELIFPEGSQTEFYAKVDKARMSVPWEDEMSDELLERIEEQKNIFGKLK